MGAAGAERKPQGVELPSLACNNDPPGLLALLSDSLMPVS